MLSEMNIIKLSKSTRKYIRREKARIRRETPELIEQDKLVTELNQRFRKS